MVRFRHRKLVLSDLLEYTLYVIIQHQFFLLLLYYPNPSPDNCHDLPSPLPGCCTILHFQNPNTALQPPAKVRAPSIKSQSGDHSFLTWGSLGEQSGWLNTHTEVAMSQHLSTIKCKQPMLTSGPPPPPGCPASPSHPSSSPPSSFSYSSSFRRFGRPQGPTASPARSCSNLSYRALLGQELRSKFVCMNEL